MRKALLSILLGIGLLASTASNANVVVSAPNDHSAVYPWYLTVQLGYSSADYTNAILRGGFAATRIDNSGLGYHLAIGYQFAPHFSSEFGVVWFDKIQWHGITGLPNGFKTKNNIVYFAGRILLPLHFIPRLQFYIKGGIGWVARAGFTINGVRVLSQRNYVMPVIGAGLLYRLAQHWTLEASYIGVPSEGTYQLPWSNFIGFGGSVWFKV